MKLENLFAWGLLATVTVTSAAPRPVVIWHGMSDWYDSPFMRLMARAITTAHPGTQVHSVRLSEHSLEDMRRGWVGKINHDIDTVCDQLRAVPGLEDGFDGVGFSQGGLFLRAYAERCNDPPMKSLMTLGSPHLGISNLPLCGASDLNCQDCNALFLQNAYTDYAQTHSIASQYFRDPDNYEQYLNKSAFLADINNERSNKNATYQAHLAQLERLVLVMFDQESIVVPKESTWFHDYNSSTHAITPLEKSTLYQENWLGLKQLGESNLIDYVKLPGDHLEVSMDEMLSLARNYLGYAAKANNPGSQAVLQSP